MRALIIVDVQNDFLSGGALEVGGADQVVPVINRLMPKFDFIVASRDWHPLDHCSFAVNHAGKRPGDVVVVEGLEEMLWPAHCIQNTRGAELAASLDSGHIARVFDKGTDPGVDSYSAFFGNARRHGTGLHEFLKDHDVTVVFVAGLATDVCVRATVLDAVDLGYETNVLEDACRAVESQPGDGAAAIAAMRRAGATITSSETLQVRHRLKKPT